MTGMEARIPFTALPDTVTVGGHRYRIRTDFRVGIAVRLLWSDTECDRVKLWYMTVVLLLGSRAAEEIFRSADMLRSAASQILYYMSDGHAEASVPFADGGTAYRPLLSYLYDEGAVYASFRSAYGMNLDRESLHLWRFDAMLSALPEDTAISKIVSVRRLDLSEIHDDSTRAMLAALKCYYALPKHEPTKPLCDIFRKAEKLCVRGGGSRVRV